MILYQLFIIRIIYYNKTLLIRMILREKRTKKKKNVSYRIKNIFKNLNCNCTLLNTTSLQIKVLEYKIDVVERNLLLLFSS